MATRYIQDTTYFRRDTHHNKVHINGTNGIDGSIELNGTTLTIWPTGGGTGLTTWGQIQGDPYDNTNLTIILNNKADDTEITTLTNNLNSLSSNVDTLSSNVGTLSSNVYTLSGDLNNYVPITQTVNGHQLNTPVVVTKGDVGCRSNT